MFFPPSRTVISCDLACDQENRVFVAQSVAWSHLYLSAFAGGLTPLRPTKGLTLETLWEC